jgi:uncharacterized membrane protein YtjA (UPF0391 family)
MRDMRVEAFLGFGGMAADTAQVARVLVYLILASTLLSLVLGLRRGFK